MAISPGAAPRFALVAHDAHKDEIVEWVAQQRHHLLGVQVISTGTTGRRIKDAFPELTVTCVKSGPLGGDQQIGAMICEHKLNALIFFVDPLSPIPHDVDVKALTRLAIVYNLPMACSRSTADLIVSGLLGKGQTKDPHRATFSKGRIRDTPALQWLIRRGRRGSEGGTSNRVAENRQC